MHLLTSIKNQIIGWIGFDLAMIPVKNFRHAIYRGLGSAILCLQEYSKISHKYDKVIGREPVLVNDHDFRSQAEGIAIPYGIYDLQANRGAVLLSAFISPCRF